TPWERFQYLDIVISIIKIPDQYVKLLGLWIDVSYRIFYFFVGGSTVTYRNKLEKPFDLTTPYLRNNPWCFRGLILCFVIGNRRMGKFPDTFNFRLHRWRSALSGRNGVQLVYDTWKNRFDVNRCTLA